MAVLLHPDKTEVNFFYSAVYRSIRKVIQASNCQNFQIQRSTVHKRRSSSWDKLEAAYSRHSENSKCARFLSKSSQALTNSQNQTYSRHSENSEASKFCFTETSSNFRSNPDQNTWDIHRTASICCARYRSKSSKALTNSPNQTYSRTKCLWCELKIFAASSKLKLLTEYVEREVMQ